MKKIKIITDSASDLNKEEIEKFNIEVLPITVTVDGVEYKDISNEEYIYKMRGAKNFFTSQPSLGLFLEKYEKWTSLGYEIISIHISDSLSGTCKTALSASKEFEGVYVIDSMTASVGIKYLIKYCYDMINKGIDISDIYGRVLEKRQDIFTYVTIDTLDNLVKGGRLRKTAGLIGNLFNLKILTKLENGELKLVEKARGKRKLVASLIKTIKCDLENRKIKKISLANVLSYEYVNMIKDEILREFDYNIKEEDIIITTPAISTHAGEKAVGIVIEAI